jgi:hypothetical protein
MHILNEGNSNTGRLAYTSQVWPILEYGAVCWDPYREQQINALDWVQKKKKKKKKQLNLHITGMIPTGKPWHSTE